MRTIFQQDREERGVGGAKQCRRAIEGEVVEGVVFIPARIRNKCDLRDGGIAFHCEEAVGALFDRRPPELGADRIKGDKGGSLGFNNGEPAADKVDAGGNRWLAWHMKPRADLPMKHGVYRRSCLVGRSALHEIFDGADERVPN